MNILRTTDKEMIARLRSANVPYRIECGKIYTKSVGSRIKVYYDFIFSEKLVKKEMDIIDKEIKKHIDEELKKEL